MSEGFKRIFLNYLIDNEAYDNFAYELHIQKGIKFETFIKEYDSTPDRVIDLAFRWDGKSLNDTEMKGYWSELHKKWKKHLES